MKISRRRFVKSLGGVLFGGIFTSVAGYNYAPHIETEWLTIERIKVPLKNLPPSLEGLKIVQLSDLHLHPFTQIDLIEKAVKLANDLEPDVVVLTGDYVLQEPESIFELAPVLAKLKTNFGVFAVYGNHDLYFPRNQAILQAGFDEAQITTLQNEGVLLQIGQGILYLAGVDDALRGRPSLTTALTNWSTNMPVILLAHEPDLADQFARDGRVSLQLSGHSHGGQVRLPMMGALQLPKLGQKYDQGLYQVKEMWLYTNRGIGLVGPPIRINCPPEISEITLVGWPVG